MTWHAFHRRGDVLREVVSVANQRRDGRLPLDLPGVSETFVDDVDLIGALLLKWHSRLSGNVERCLADEPMDLPSAVARAWALTAEQLPGVRRVADALADEPTSPEMDLAMRRARRAERVRLAQAAGLANDESDRAAEVGRRIEEEARTGLPVQVWSRPRPRYRAQPAPRADVQPTGQEPAPKAETERPRPRGRDSFVDRIKAVLPA